MTNLHVSIGEVKTGRGQQILKASLGSCVGIAFFWKKQSLYGLAHCLLPEAPASAQNLSARFVSQAVPSLLALMKVSPEERREIEAVIVGGGNMTAPPGTPPEKLVGHHNALAADKYLQQFKIAVIHRDFGGESGRKIMVFCESGEYTVQLIPRIANPAA